jgi:hypothetical protein
VRIIVATTRAALIAALSVLLRDFDWITPESAAAARHVRHTGCGRTIAVVHAGDKLTTALDAALTHRCEQREYCDEREADVTNDDSHISPSHQPWCSLHPEVTATGKSTPPDAVASLVTITEGQPAPVHVPADVAKLVQTLAYGGQLLSDQDWGGADVIEAVVLYLDSYGLRTR